MRIVTNNNKGNRLTLVYNKQTNNKRYDYNYVKILAVVTIGLSEQIGFEQALKMI